MNVNTYCLYYFKTDTNRFLLYKNRYQRMQMDTDNSRFLYTYYVETDTLYPYFTKTHTHIYPYWKKRIQQKLFLMKTDTYCLYSIKKDKSGLLLPLSGQKRVQTDRAYLSILYAVFDKKMDTHKYLHLRDEEKNYKKDKLAASVCIRLYSFLSKRNLFVSALKQSKQQVSVFMRQSFCCI